VYAELDNGPAFKLKEHFHGIGNVAIVIYCKFASMGCYGYRRSFANEPADHIHIMDSPVTHLRRIIAPPPKTVRSNVVLVVPPGTWSKPHIPVQVLWRCFRFHPPDTIREHVGDPQCTGCAYLTDESALNLCGQLLVYGSASPVETHGTDPAGALLCFHQGPAFLYGYGQRLFHVHILSCFHGLDGLDGMPVVGGGNANRVNILLLQQLSEVGIAFYLSSKAFTHSGNFSQIQVALICRKTIPGNVRLIYITKGGHLYVWVFHKVAQEL